MALPIAMASSNPIGNPSQREGSTKISAAASTSGTSWRKGSEDHFVFDVEVLYELQGIRLLIAITHHEELEFWILLLCLGKSFDEFEWLLLMNEAGYKQYQYCVWRDVQFLADILKEAGRIKFFLVDPIVDHYRIECREK